MSAAGEWNFEFTRPLSISRRDHELDPYFLPRSCSPLSEHSIESGPVRLGEDDVKAMLTKLAQENPEKLNWQESITDLLKPLKLDCSKSARVKLAKKLEVDVGEVGSAQRNNALYAAVFRELAENDGQVPEKMRD